MSIYWLCSLLTTIYLSTVQMQIVRVNSNLTNITSDSFTHVERQRPHLTILAALESAEHLNIVYNATSPTLNANIDIVSSSFIIDSNPLLTTLKLCELGSQSHAKVIIAGHIRHSNDLTLTGIAYVSDFYHIPVLTIASRENIFSDKVSRLMNTHTHTPDNDTLMSSSMEMMLFVLSFVRHCIIS
jgi:hypothetical protein